MNKENICANQLHLLIHYSMKKKILESIYVFLELCSLLHDSISVLCQQVTQASDQLTNKEELSQRSPPQRPVASAASTSQQISCNTEGRNAADEAI